MGRIRGLWAASALFFLSGATGLAYEVVWFRRFAHIWGASSLAMGAVVASFLLGLGIGAHFMGRAADRARIPLKGYAWCELGIGLLALLIPLECALLSSLSGMLYPLLHGVPFLHTIVRLLLTFLVIGPPCVLMGGTFPLLVRQFTPPGGQVGSGAGWLYAVNTGGAALGCYLAGFHLLPSLGLSGTNLLAAALNGAVAGTAFLLARTLDRPGEKAGQAPAPPPAPSPNLRPLYVAAALTGLASLLLQMVWTRQLCVMLGGSTYALSATLFVILLGIGLGSLLAHAWIDRLADPARAAAWALGLLALSTGAAKVLLIPKLTVAVALSRPLRSLELGNAAVCVGASAALEFLPSVCMGFVFPLLVHLTRRGAADAGRAVGSVYAWNTAGSIVGAAATAPLGLALFGSGVTMAAALSLYLVAAILLAPPRTWRETAALAGAMLLAAGGILLGARRLDPMITDEGMYLYGYRETGKWTLLSFKEGASCNVIVTERLEDRALAVNGKVDATSAGDMDMQLGIAYFPRFLRPHAKNLLVIGYGSGTTAGASLLFPGTRVTCCEIEPAVFAASKYFEDVNHTPEKRLKDGFSIVFDDGRSHLQGSRETYDLILSEPSNPWLAGVSSLFTREFYEVCKRRLGGSGVLAQWIQLYAFSEEEYALVVRTVTSAFPYAALLRVSGGDSVLLASEAPILPGREAIDAAQALVDSLPLVREDLTDTYEGADVRSLLLRRLLLDESGLKRVAARVPAQTINTDVNLRLEFDAPLRLFHSDLSPDDDMDPPILEAASALWFGKMIEGWGCSEQQVEALRWLAGLFSRHRQFTVAVEILDHTLRFAPDSPGLLADRAIAMRGTDEEWLGKTAARLVADAPEEAVRVGLELWRESKYKQAASIFEQLVAANPGSVTGWKNLAMNYERLAEWEKGEAAWQKLLALDPLSETLRKEAADFRKERDKRKK